MESICSATYSGTMRSNALSKSNESRAALSCTYAGSRLDGGLMMCCRAWDMAPRAMPACLPGRKPNCESSNKGSRVGCMRLKSTDSNVLNRVHRRPMGR
eukprot:114234-Amphidinium_carterae.1